MGLSHQKIALSRDLVALSNEYPNSLTQTKLIYDYYGSGDRTNPITYNILMTPSALNDYMPTFIIDTSNRVVLNNKYAQAARMARIPQEGPGTVPSDIMRNTFMSALTGAGLITEKAAKINAKEEILDLKMKNIDTELSSLNTEYDTVKNTLFKNVEKHLKDIMLSFNVLFPIFPVND